MRDRFTRWIWAGTLPAILTFVIGLSMALVTGAFLLAAGIDWLTHL